MDHLDIAYKYGMQAIEFDECYVVVTLTDGRKVSLPLDWFPFLQAASSEQRASYDLTESSVFWEALDDGFSMETVILGLP